MAEEEYEVIPHQLLADLKYEVEALKKKLNRPDAKMNELLLEIEGMKDSVQELTTIFQKTLEQMSEDNDPAKLLQTVSAKLETVVKQNETIAKGMVAVADRMEGFGGRATVPQTKRVTPTSIPVQHSMGGPPPPRGPARVAPRPATPPPTGASDLPPPPPGGKKKNLLGGIFK